MKCPNCNYSDNRSDAKFCSNCGTALNGLSSDTVLPQPNTGSKIIDNLIKNMVFVEGGTFNMANNPDTHKVSLASFFIGRYEVTQEEWEEVMEYNPSHFIGAKHPVDNINWNDCQEFIHRLNTITGMSFRLPTEAEWEFAAIGGVQSKGFKYIGSDTIDEIGWYAEMNWKKGGTTPEGGTRPVGRKVPNELGLYDMFGNVFEWCKDWFDDYSLTDQTNPQGPSSGFSRVLRGGSWNRCRFVDPTDRNCSLPWCREDHYGFRLAL